MTTRVECAEYFPVRDQALLAHATQVDPEGSWFSVPLDIHRRAWSTEDWELARTRVAGQPARGRPVRRNRRRRPTSAIARVQCRYDRSEHFAAGFCSRSSPTSIPTSSKPGWTPLLITCCCSWRLVFLFLSMQRQMRKIRTPDDIEAERAAAAEECHSPETRPRRLPLRVIDSAQPAGGRDQPVPAAARRQPGRTGSRGRTRPSPRPSVATCRCSSVSATRPATGAT